MSFLRKQESRIRKWIPDQVRDDRKSKMKKSQLKITTALKKKLSDALAEDLGKGDITTQLVIPQKSKVEALIVAKETCVLAGGVLIPEIFKLLSSKVKVQLLKKDGLLVKKGQFVAKIKGPSQEILTGERLSLNFLAHLSGIATLTQSFVKEIKPAKAEILATRKTTPLMRDFEKYAVQCGGGNSHRFGLFDQYLLKDNHKIILMNMSDKEAIVAYTNIMEKRKKNIPFEIEIDSIKELVWALAFRPDIILLDNFPPKELIKTVYLNKELCKGLKIKKPLLEASGGVTLKTVKQIAKTGVDRISVGALTHSARSIDFGLEIE